MLAAHLGGRLETRRQFTPLAPMPPDYDDMDFGAVGLGMLRFHPEHLATPEAHAARRAMQVWMHTGCLPYPGGHLDQPACLLAAWDIMASAEADCRRAYPQEA